MSGRAFGSLEARGENPAGRGVFVQRRPGIHALVSRPADQIRDEAEERPPAEQPRGSEQELARGRVEQTPFTMINWVGVAIGAIALVALALVVVAYVLA